MSEGRNVKIENRISKLHSLRSDDNKPSSIKHFIALRVIQSTSFVLMCYFLYKKVQGGVKTVHWQVLFGDVTKHLVVLQDIDLGKIRALNVLNIVF